MTTIDKKIQIERSITAFSQGNLRENGIRLLKSLGYASDRQVIVEPNTFAGFAEIHPPLDKINIKKALVDNWLSVDILFQLTGEDLKQMAQGHFIFDKNRIDNQIIESYLFISIELTPEDYSRTKLADITREVNKFFAMPVMILFKYGDLLTLSIINRRLHKKDPLKDVLEKVTLIKDINIKKPIRAHVEILFDLSLPELENAAQLHNFVDLHQAWQRTLDITELNKRFYREIANWYFYAVDHVEFPIGTIEDRQTRNATNVIRLITRLIFVWFIKEKGLVPDALFNPAQLKEILNFTDPQKSTYYKAILQNLFFATLNTEMGPDRRFRGKNKNPNGLDAHHGISTVYRYEDFFIDPVKGLALFAGIPFLNGGLFECLDKREENILVDGFSDVPCNQPMVPDSLFFGCELTVDMTEIYGDKHHSKEKVRGLIRIFDSYKFTIEENTPLDEEIALDPELLGKVFENLLAAYNPETGTTARKQTGSFYTPPEIVNYMVDESLIAYLENSLVEGEPNPDKKLLIESKLRHLLSYNNEHHQFTDEEANQIITTIDKIKILDPACGSGAFPMGMLHKLVFIIKKLDNDNIVWQELQRQKAIEETEEAYQIGNQEERRQRLLDIDETFENNSGDYGRKLYLIENCIYGVDIQPIAVQIAKLRFFISLVVDQAVNYAKPNLGIRPLPNLESKFVIANTLISIEENSIGRVVAPNFTDHLVREKRLELKEIRHKIFRDRTAKSKREHREKDKLIRSEISKLIEADWGETAASRLANWDPYDQNSSACFFDPEWMFGIINGFNIIIANPPYGANIDSYISLLEKQYPNTTKSFKDSYKIFIEVALAKLLRNDGIISYIVPNTILHQPRFNNAREFLLKHKILIVLNLGMGVFEQVVVPTCVFIAQKSAIPNNSIRYKDLSIKSEYIGSLTFETNYIDVGKVFSIKKDGYQDFLTLDSVLDFKDAGINYQRVKVGMNVKGNSDLGRRLLYEGNKESNEDMEYWKGEDIDSYYISPKTNRFVRMNTINNLRGNERVILNKDYFHRIPKLIWRQTAAYPMAALDMKGIWFGRSIQAATINQNFQYLKYEFLLGILNSKFLNWKYCQLVQETGRIFPQVKLEYLRSLPFCNVKSDQQDSIINIVKEIILAKTIDPKTDTSKLTTSIDMIVYELYGLTDDEITIIEGKSTN